MAEHMNSRTRRVLTRKFSSFGKYNFWRGLKAGFLIGLIIGVIIGLYLK